MGDKNNEIIPVLKEDLTDDQRKELKEYVDNYEKLCLQSFSKTRTGAPFRKGDYPKVGIHEEGSSSSKLTEHITEEEWHRFEGSMYQMFNQAMTNHSKVFANSIVDAFKHAQGVQGARGPTYFARNSSYAHMDRGFHDGLEANKTPTGNPNPPPAANQHDQTGGNPIGEEAHVAPTGVIPPNNQVPPVANSPRYGYAAIENPPIFENQYRRPMDNRPPMEYEGYYRQSPIREAQYRTHEVYRQQDPNYDQRNRYAARGYADPDDNMADRIAQIMTDQFGLKPKERTFCYRPPYPEWYDRVPLPHRYRIPDFTKFTGNGKVTTMEHVSRYLSQLGEAASEEALKVRLFSQSLSELAFAWFTSLSPNSIRGWADLEDKFHQYFFSGNQELKLSDLTAVRQRMDESVTDYVQRFRDVRARCYSLRLTDPQIADLAFQGLLAPIKEKFSSQDFDSLSQLVQKVSAHEARFSEMRKEKFMRKINYQSYSSDSDSEGEIAAADWATRGKRVVTCPWARRPDKEEHYDFDINKADKIFDILLQEKQLVLPPGHIIPSPEELKRRKYCKWHNSSTHYTNECKTFRQHIQSAVEQGRIKFDSGKAPMKVDGNPFPVNMVHGGYRGEYNKGKARFGSEAIIKRYQRQQEQASCSYYETEEPEFDPHWSCEFFQYCWNSGIRLPSAKNCPVCNQEEPMKQESTQRRSVYQRLGPIKEEPFDEELIQRENQWCPSGLFTKNQKRRVQRLRHREIAQERYANRPRIVRKEWRVKAKTDDQVRREADVGMVFFLPSDFRARVESDDEEPSSAQLCLEPQQAIFDKPEEEVYRHLKPLYVRGFINGKPMSKMLVDGGAAINIMPYSTYRKIGKTSEELVKTNMVLKDFGGNSSEPKGVVNVELTVGSKTIPTTFFIIDGQGSYSVLLGRDWIHANCCVPSTMHQSLIQWDGDQIEIVQADKSVNVAIADLSIWELKGIECISGKAWEGEFLDVTSDGIQPIVDGACSLQL